MRVKNLLAPLAALLLTVAIGCTSNKANTPDVKDQVSKALDNAGYKDLKVAVNNDKQLVTLSGDVKTQEDKDQGGRAGQKYRGRLCGFK